MRSMLAADYEERRGSKRGESSEGSLNGVVRAARRGGGGGWALSGCASMDDVVKFRAAETARICAKASRLRKERRERLPSKVRISQSAPACDNPRLRRHDSARSSFLPPAHQRHLLIKMLSISGRAILGVLALL